MQRMFAGLIVMLMMAAGLVGVSGSSANAACPYTGCIRTNTRVNADDVEQHRRATIVVRVTTSSNRQPRGQVTVRVKRRHGGYFFLDSTIYRGGKVYVRTDRLHKPGKYIVKAIFDRKPGSPYRDSDNRTTFRVRR